MTKQSLSRNHEEERSAAEAYMESLFDRDDILTMVEESIRANGMPEISIAPGYGRLLTMLVRISNAANVLELGSLGGYSGICLARGLGPTGRLTCLELKQEFADVARANVEKAGFGARTEYRIGEALDSLKQLEEEGRSFDFVFIDADKENYPRYLEWAIKLANPGALIVGDNAWMKGRAANPQATSPSVQAMRSFNAAIASDPRLEGVLLPAYDGLAVARVK